MRKRLIALMISGIVISSTLTGCATQSVDAEWFGQPTTDDGYIILEQNDTHIMHRGDYYKSSQGNSNGFNFACGEEFQSNAHFFSYRTEPKEDRYDKKCEKCFGIEQ